MPLRVNNDIDNNTTEASSAKLPILWCHDTDSAYTSTQPLLLLLLPCFLCSVTLSLSLCPLLLPILFPQCPQQLSSTRTANVTTSAAAPAATALVSPMLLLQLRLVSLLRRLSCYSSFYVYCYSISSTRAAIKNNTSNQVIPKPLTLSSKKLRRPPPAWLCWAAPIQFGSHSWLRKRYLRLHRLRVWGLGFNAA